MQATRVDQGILRKLMKIDFHRSLLDTLATSLTWGLLDSGHVYQRNRAANARSAESLANYEQPVLMALDETGNALSDFARERRRMEHLMRAAEASRSAATSLVTIYKALGAGWEIAPAP